MKKLLLACVLGASLCSCSLLQRHDSEEDPGVRDLEPGQMPPVSAAVEPEPPAPALDSEISKLHTKISALETKVEVLSASLERMQAQKSQPVIQAEIPPQANMAAPVEGEKNPEETAQAPEVQENSPQISAAPARPAAFPPATNSSDLSQNSDAEKEFRSAMRLFQSGRNLEAASRFAMVSKKYPNHLLAAHSLYWAGEASARGQQWSLAIENWSELEKKYPHSAYLPESLAGLAKAYDNQGDAAKSHSYRTTLLRAFPKSPVALRMQPIEQGAAEGAHRASASPRTEAEPSGEDAPVFTHENPAGEGNAESQ